MPRTIDERVDVVARWVDGKNQWAVVYDAPRSRKLREVGQPFDEAEAAYTFRQGFVEGLKVSEETR